MCTKEDKISHSDILIFHYELDDGSWEGVLTPSALKDVIIAGKLEYPNMSEDEIKDRSRGDAISKSLTDLRLI